MKVKYLVMQELRLTQSRVYIQPNVVTWNRGKVVPVLN
jgi:hypothetical protein